MLIMERHIKYQNYNIFNATLSKTPAAYFYRFYILYEKKLE